MTERTSWTIQSTPEPAPLSAQLLDFSDYSDEDLKLVAEAATKEIEARKVLREAPIVAEATARSYQMAVVRNVPAGETVDWTQPTGAHDAYPKGWRVKHNGKIWWSTIPANVWEPGVTGWTEERSDGGYPLWIQPMGAHDAYKVGAIVEHKGTLWRNTSDNNVWEPGVFGWEQYDPAAVPEVEFVFTPEEAVEWVAVGEGYPAGSYVRFGDGIWVSETDNNQDQPGTTEAWTRYVAPEPEPEPETPVDPVYGTDAASAVAWVDNTSGYPEGAYVTHAGNVWVSDVDLNIEEPGTGDLWTQCVEPEPEPDPEPTYPEWVRPTGGHDAYKIGDRVMFQGKAYESKINGNTWSPTEYPQGWTEL